MSNKSRFNSSGIELEPVYTPDSIKGVPPTELPGEFPFTRGVYPTMYRGKPWTMRQYAGFASARESNARYKLLLDQGQSGLSVAFDLPTQMGYDSDHVMATGEVGKVGVAISTIEDMQILLDDLPLDKISTSMTINSTAAILLAFYISVAESRGIASKDLRGTIQNDVLKEYVARGTYIFPPKASLRIITDIFAYAKDQVPNWNTISISGYHIREAGSTAAQEIAFTLANAKTYVDAAISAGLEVDSFAPRLSFFFNVHNNFFEEVAKFRAARTLWAEIMKTQYKAKNPKSWLLRFHTQTAGSTLTAQQNENNVVRVAYQALAAVLGGTQSLHTNSKDEAIGLPTQEAATLALRTQQVLANETGMTDVADPLGGSYFIEKATSDLVASSNKIMQQISSMGGVVKCIESGWIQNQIQKSAYEYQKEVDNVEKKIVGVNCYTQDNENLPEPSRIDPATVQDQLGRLKKFKHNRDNSKVKSHLEKLANCARGQDSLLPVIVDSVKAHATLGEISDTLRKVFGIHKENVTL